MITKHCSINIITLLLLVGSNRRLLVLIVFMVTNLLLFMDLLSTFVIITSTELLWSVLLPDFGYELGETELIFLAT